MEGASSSSAAVAGLVAAEESDMGYLLSVLHVLGSMRLSSAARRYYPYSCVVCVLILLFLASQVTAVSSMGSADVNKITLALCVGTTVLVTFFKTVNTLCMEDSLLEVMDRARMDYARFVQQEDLPEVVRTSRILRFLSKAYLIFGGCVAALWMLSSAVNGERSSRSLPFVGSFPFDVSTFPGFELAYLFHTFIMLYVYLLSLSPDLIFVNCIVQACLQLRIVRRNLAKLNARRHTLEEAEAEEGETYQQLRRCIQHHQTIIRYMRFYESTCSNVLLLQSTSLSTVMCFLLYQLTKQASIVESLRFLAYFAVILMQTLILCLFGDMLISDSESVLFAAYSSFWLTTSPRFKKSINIIMAQAGNPITISAGSFFVFSKETFISILQMSSSFFTVLSSMNSE